MNEDLASHPTTVVAAVVESYLYPRARAYTYVRASRNETVCIPNPFFERSRGGHSSTCAMRRVTPRKSARTRCTRLDSIDAWKKEAWKSPMDRSRGNRKTIDRRDRDRDRDRDRVRQTRGYSAGRARRENQRAFGWGFLPLQYGTYESRPVFSR